MTWTNVRHPPHRCDLPNRAGIEEANAWDESLWRCEGCRQVWQLEGMASSRGYNWVRYWVE